MPADTYLSMGPFGPWFLEFMDRHQAEIRSRGLRLRLELDPEWIVEKDDVLGRAIRELLQLIFVSVPDGCEIYVGGSRSLTAVSRIGCGFFNARWQVTGETSSVSTGSSPTPLRPRPGDAERHLRSALAKRVRDGFAATRWQFSIEGIEGGRECLAHACCS